MAKCNQLTLMPIKGLICVQCMWVMLWQFVTVCCYTCWWVGQLCHLSVLLSILLVGRRHCKSEACSSYRERHRHVAIWDHPQRPCHCANIILDY